VLTIYTLAAKELNISLAAIEKEIHFPMEFIVK
jgi:hypothetical protein